MNKKMTAILFLIAILFVSVIAGTIVYYNGQANENTTFVDVDYLSYGAPTQNNYNSKWTLSLNLKNTGNTNAIITNIIMDGQPYSSFNPIPIVNPSIKNGYILSPNQNVTITIQGSNTSTVPTFHKDSVISVETINGKSYSTFLGS